MYFYAKVVDTIIITFTKESSDIVSVQHDSFCKIIKIDIS